MHPPTCSVPGKVSMCICVCVLSVPVVEVNMWRRPRPGCIDRSRMSNILTPMLPLLLPHAARLLMH